MQANNVVMQLTGSLLYIAILVLSFGCAPASQQSGNGPSRSDATSDIPEITDEIIFRRINNAWVSEVPEENGAAKPIDWHFIESEPKEIKVVDKRVESTTATIVLDIKTTSSPRSREQRYLSGQIRTQWELSTGWVLRQWEIVDTDNISMKYRDLPSLPANNVDR